MTSTPTTLPPVILPSFQPSSRSLIQPVSLRPSVNTASGGNIANGSGQLPVSVVVTIIVAATVAFLSLLGLALAYLYRFHVGNGIIILNPSSADNVEVPSLYVDRDVNKPEQNSYAKESIMGPGNEVKLEDHIEECISFSASSHFPQLNATDVNYRPVAAI